MALIKCSDCNKEISDKANVCPECGCPVDVYLDNDVKVEKKRKINGIAVVYLVLGIFSIMWGLSLSYGGSRESLKTYGGDAYTGMQNASVKTANNVESLGDTISKGFKGILIVIGGTLFTYGISNIRKMDE